VVEFPVVTQMDMKIFTSCWVRIDEGKYNSYFTLGFIFGW